MLQVHLKLIGQYGVQIDFYIKILIYHDYSMHKLKVHKYFLSIH
jgi:hypothetical protein